MLVYEKRVDRSYFLQFFRLQPMSQIGQLSMKPHVLTQPQLRQTQNRKIIQPQRVKRQVQSMEKYLKLKMKAAKVNKLQMEVKKTNKIHQKTRKRKVRVVLFYEKKSYYIFSSFLFLTICSKAFEL